MDALLTSFLAAALGEFGDRTQILVAFLAIRFGRARPVLLGAAVGALASALIAGVAGAMINGLVTVRALSLLVAVAMIYTGATGFFTKKPLEIGRNWKTGPFVTTAFVFFLAEFGDKTQFLTFALSAQYDAAMLTVLGATAGVVAAAAPAALLAKRFEAALPLRPIRYAVAALFLLGGFIVAINALRLV